MTRKSPTKRKSLAPTTPGTTTPKKQKLDAQTPKRELETPKNVPKTPKMEHKTPKNTPKSMKKEGATPFAKTPKSRKKGNKQIENGINEELKSSQIELEHKPDLVAKTPKSVKKQKNKPVTPKPAPKVEMDNSDVSNEEIDMKNAKLPQKFKKESEVSSGESDYEVECEIKPEKVTKSLNENILDDDDYIISHNTQQNNDNNQSSSEVEKDDEQENAEQVLKKKSKKEKQQKSEDQSNKQPGQNKKPDQNKKPQKFSAIIDLKDLNKGGIMKKGQTRYVLFVNNIPYTATKNQIKEHFAKACLLKDVRIPMDKKNNKPKGFCYIELHTEAEYQKALSVHHTFMNGRRINVLYTSPGQKNSDKKKKEIKKKNFKLQGMRKQGMLKGVPSDTQKRSARRAKKRFFDKQKAEKKSENQV